MLLMGDLSGIQDFLFDVRESGGKQTATLRFRSLRLQLIVECIARRVLWAFDLSENEHLLYCTAGKFAIEAPHAAPNDARLAQIQADVNTWLLANTHGRLRCAIITDDALGTAAQRNDHANTKLQRHKLQPWARDLWAEPSLIIPATFDLNAENERDVETGNRLKNATTIALTDVSDPPCWTITGVSVRFTDHVPTAAGNGRSSISLERIVRHTPRHADGSLIEFIDLAQHSRGAPVLGLLKADADSLGAAIRNRLGTSTSFQPLVDFSRKLDGFFGHTLDQQMSDPRNTRWNLIYTVFAGGDDLLLVGPWNVLIDFAAHVREQFIREFAADKLTLSAGCAIVKPKFPIHLSAQQAEALLEQAKQQPAKHATSPKDQFAALGGVWKWDDNAKIINAGKQLADWADPDLIDRPIQRGWLHTLLELALLRRGESASRDASVIPAMATSRLSYHVARNWPKENAPGEKGQARQGVETVLRHFDNYEQTKDPVTTNLPAVLRYAMLATRSKGDLE